MVSTWKRMAWGPETSCRGECRGTGWAKGLLEGKMWPNVLGLWLAPSWSSKASFLAGQVRPCWISWDHSTGVARCEKGSLVNWQMTILTLCFVIFCRRRHGAAAPRQFRFLNPQVCSLIHHSLVFKRNFQLEKPRGLIRIWFSNGGKIYLETNFIEYCRVLNNRPLLLIIRAKLKLKLGA